MSKFGVGQSKVNTWRRCRQEYQYKYVENLQRKATKRPLFFGKIVHRMIEENGEGKNPMKVLREVKKSIDKMGVFETEKQEMYETVEDARLIMSDYFDYWPKDEFKLIPQDDENGETRYTEHEFALDIGDDIVFKGQIDGIIKTPNKLRWVMENKSFNKALPSEDHRWRNLQTVVYARAIEMLGWVRRIDGVMWNYIKSKPPTVPHQNKDGRLSKAHIVTLPRVWWSRIEEFNLDPDDYKDQIAQAVASRDEYFQHIYTPINRTVADNIWTGFVASAVEMRDNHGRRDEMNLGRHCEWCDYESVCRAKLTGSDVDFVKEREFTREDPEAYRRSRRDEVTGVPRRKPAVRTPKLRVVR